MFQRLSPRPLTTLISILALLPAVFIISVGLSFFVAPENPVAQAMARWTADPQTLHWFNLLSPVVVLGGTALAIGLNVLSMLRLDLRREGGEWEGRVRFKLNNASVALILLSVLLTAILLTYVLTENWACIVGQQVRC